MEKQAGRQAGSPGPGRIRENKKKNNLCFWLLHSQVFYVFGELLKCAACLSVYLAMGCVRGRRGRVLAGSAFRMHVGQIVRRSAYQVYARLVLSFLCLVCQCVCVCKLAKISTILQAN